MRYLLDSDVLIAAKNLYYRPGFCEAFWDWLEDAHLGSRVFSIDKVQTELLAGEDEDHLRQWAKNKSDTFFLPTRGTLHKWRDLSIWANSIETAFTPAAKDKFLTVEAADAWLIAFAAHHGNYTIVTNEVSNTRSKSSIKLPDAAAALGISTINLFDLLDRLANKSFSYFDKP